MKIVIIIVRVVTGLLYAVSAFAYFFNLMPQQEMTGATLVFVQGLAAAGYFMPLLKSIELIFGISLIIGRFVPLSLVVLFPVTLNIFLFHIFLAPEALAVPIGLLTANLFLAYCYRASFKPLVVAHTAPN
jgi:putative oxidoreductase